MATKRSGAICALLAIFLLAGVATSAAAADRSLSDVSRTDATGGAQVRVQLWQRDTDGAVYPRIWVADTKADGVCAHAAVNWVHVNGNTYSDTDTASCGAGTGSTEPSVKGARNWRAYRSVSIAAFVDKGAPATAALYDFVAGPPLWPGMGGAPPPTIEPIDHDRGGSGGGGGDRSCGARVPLMVRETEPAKPVATKHLEQVGSVQNCVLRREGDVFGRTYLRLDEDWDLHAQPAESPLTIRTTLHEGGPDTDGRPGGEDFRQREGQLAVNRKYSLTRAFGRDVTGFPTFVDRPDEGTYVFETARLSPRPSHTYQTQSEVTRPRRLAFIASVPTFFAGWAPTLETLITDAPFAGTTLEWDGGVLHSAPAEEASGWRWPASAGEHADQLPTDGARPYSPPKKGRGQPVKTRGGYPDEDGNVWEWAKGGAQHGGPHWDVQHPNGSHTNVAPNGTVIGPDNFPNKRRQPSRPPNAVPGRR